MNSPTSNQQDKRGRRASTPTEIPPVGWKDILWRVYREISKDRVLLIAAGVTFYLLLAFVPALTALVSIYGIFVDASQVQEHIGMISGALPAGGREVINEQLERLASQDSETLGWALALSVTLALWSTNGGMKAIFDAINVAYDESESRGFVKLTIISLGFTLITVAGVIVIMGAAVLLTAFVDNFGFSVPFQWLLRIVGYAVMVLLLSVAIASIYRWGPSRANAKWRWVTPGCAVSTVVMIAAAIAFSWYVANFASYNATYGSLGALIGFMTWVWLSVIILILGAELNAEIEHQTRLDSTVGPERPMGQRGAEMADTVGESVKS